MQVLRVVYRALEEADKELLENNRAERGHIEDEIRELRERNVSTMSLSVAAAARRSTVRSLHPAMNRHFKLQGEPKISLIVIAVTLSTAHQLVHIRQN